MEKAGLADFGLYNKARPLHLKVVSISLSRPPRQQIHKHIYQKVEKNKELIPTQTVKSAHNLDHQILST